jgi:hypothetical protein
MFTIYLQLTASLNNTLKKVITAVSPSAVSAHECYPKLSVHVSVAQSCVPVSVTQSSLCTSVSPQAVCAHQCHPKLSVHISVTQSCLCTLVLPRALHARYYYPNLLREVLTTRNKNQSRENRTVSDLFVVCINSYT